MGEFKLNVGLLLYMKTKNNPTIINCGNDLYKYLYFGSDEKVYVSNVIHPKFIEILADISSENIKFIYFDSKEYDSKNMIKLIKNGLVKFKLNKKLTIYKQKYKYYSKNKLKYKTTMIPLYIKKYCNYTIESQKYGLSFSKITYLSYGQKAEKFNDDNGCKISRQSIYLHEKQHITSYIHRKEKEIMNEIKRLNISESGYYNYDEEFIKISKKIYVRLTIIDAKTRVIINDQLYPKEEFGKNLIKRFLIESLNGLYVNTIITDGFTAYNEIIEEIGAKHQTCIFHLMQNLMTPLTKYINKRKRRIESLETKVKQNEDKIKQLKSKIKLRRGRYSNKDKKAKLNLEKRKKLKKEIREYKEKIKKYKKEIKENNYYKEKIRVMFRSKTLRTALNRFNQLKDKIDELPKIIADYIKNLSKKLQRAFEYTQDNDIPKTNNLVELLFRTTYPGKIKRIYRTYEGAINKIKLNNIRWFERVVIPKYSKT